MAPLTDKTAFLVEAQSIIVIGQVDASRLSEPNRCFSLRRLAARDDHGPVPFRAELGANVAACIKGMDRRAQSSDQYMFRSAAEALQRRIGFDDIPVDQLLLDSPAV